MSLSEIRGLVFELTLATLEVVRVGVYSQFSQEELILRDLLAIDRTILANERTYLAYIRTALAIFLSGVSLIRFFDFWLAVLTGWVFVPIGGLVFILGTIRYQRMKRLIGQINSAANNTNPTGMSLNE